MKLMKTLTCINLFSGFLFKGFLQYNTNNKLTLLKVNAVKKNINFRSFIYKNIKMTGVPNWVNEKTPEHASYEIVEKRFNNFFNFVYTIYEHKKTKAQIISVISNDELDVEQALVIYVKTITHTDQGIPHILEHAVLGDSKKYRDSFKNLLNSSLQTLLNASTYNDRTVYLIRSPNNKDFLNLLDVYMDCVYQPRVLHEPYIFYREGWFYNLTPLTDKEKEDDNIPKIDNYKVGFNGVVYSEMKGNMTPLRISYYEVSKLLFPDNYHSKCSGGVPLEIPSLSYEDFKKFYYKNYNPKKIKIMISGNRNCKEVLDFVDKYLSELDLSLYKDDEVENMEEQKYREGPFYEIKTYDNISSNKEHLVLISWLLNPKPNENDTLNLQLDEPFDLFVFYIINYLLIGTPSSVLYKALINCGIGNGVISDGVDADLIQYNFSVGLKGILEKDEQGKNRLDNVDKLHYEVEKVVINALQDVTKNGFNKDSIEAAINQIEFALNIANTDTAKGTHFLLQMVSKLNYNKDPMDYFEHEKHLNNIKDKIKTEKFFLEKYVEKHFLKNNHRAVILVKGDENYGKEFKRKEQEQLKKKLSNLTEEEKKQLVDEYFKLQNFNLQQPTPDDINNFPTLSKNDLNKRTLEVPVNVIYTNCEKENDLEEYEKLKNDKNLADINLQYFNKHYALKYGFNNKKELNISNHEHIKSDNIPVLIHEIPTYDVTYLQFKISLDDLTLDELYYLPLFKSILLENRTNKRSENEFINLKETYIGKLKMTVETYYESNNLHVVDKYNCFAFLNVEIHTLNHKCSKAIEILHEALHDSDFTNKEKVTEILKRFIDDFKTAFANDPNSLLLYHLYSNISSDGYIKNIMNGYDNYVKLLELLELAKNNYQSIENILNNIRSKLLKSQVILNVTADKKSLELLFKDANKSLKRILSSFKNDINKKNTIQWNMEIIKNNLLEKTIKDVLYLSTSVNYVGMSGSIFDKNEFLNPSFMVAVFYLKRNYLWSIVRELNGAYGVYAGISYDGSILFHSYRDPNIEKTLQSYKDSIQALRKAAENMTDKELLRYIIGTLKTLDEPKRGINLGKLSFSRVICNETEEDRIKYREHIMNTTKEDFNKFADLLENKVHEMEKNIVIITNETNANKFVEDNPDFKKMLIE